MNRKNHASRFVVSYLYEKKPTKVLGTLKKSHTIYPYYTPKVSASDKPFSLFYQTFLCYL